MNFSDMYLTTIRRSDVDFKRALDGLTTDELCSQPAGPRSNPIGWLVWHMTKARDSIVSGVGVVPTVWDRDGWAARFGMEGELPSFTPDNVSEFDPQSLDTLVEYFDAVAEHTANVVEGLDDDDMERMVEPSFPGRPAQPVVARLAHALNDNIQHIGQIAYLRGLIRDQGWY